MFEQIRYHRVEESDAHDAGGATAADLSAFLFMLENVRVIENYVQKAATNSMEF